MFGCNMTYAYSSKGYIRPNNKISVFRVTGLNILGRVGTQIFFIFVSGKNIVLYILKGIMHTIIFFPEN